MRLLTSLVCVVFAIISTYHTAHAQLPPRLNIPGAVLLNPQRAGPFRQQRIQQGDLQPRPRRPNQNVAQQQPIRPVVEEVEEPATPASGGFEDEVNKLGISALQNGIRQAQPEPEEVTRPVHFRPERPVPVLRQDVRDGGNSQQRLQQAARQEQRENIPRPLLRQEAREDYPVPVRQPQRQSQSRPTQQAPQPVRQAARASAPRQPTHYDDDERPRNRKPVVQILRKYRTDNADGSITWGFENDDGTFKEETLGIDCVTKGKYGYIDPDGVRREYTYETGNRCDPNAEEEEEEQLLQSRPQSQPQLQARKPSFRPGGQI